MAGAETPPFPLIGMEGTDFVSVTMGTNPPQVATKIIQKAAGLQQPLCPPLLGLLDQLGVSRYDAHLAVLKSAKKMLLAQVQEAHPKADQVRLERLLNASFKYLGIQELKEAPLAVMEKLEQVPPVFLKQLALDKAIFRELSPKVQRQVWEFDKNLLQADALPPVGRYKYETATIMRALAMDEFLPVVGRALRVARRRAAVALEREERGEGDGAGEGGGGGGGLSAVAVKPGNKRSALVAGLVGVGRDDPALDDEEGDSDGGSGLRLGGGGRGGGRGAGGAGRGAAGRGPSQLSMPRPVTRKILRKGSSIVQLLREMVGSSPKIYQQIVELCTVKYRDSDSLYVGFKDSSYCSLRANLLMALHDMNSPVAARDRCHELAWTLDAGITNGFLTDKHQARLVKFFEDLIKSEKSTQELKKRTRPGHVQDEAESAGNMLGASAIEPYMVLGDAAVILRDPSAQHLLAGAVMQRVLPAALEGKLPSQLPDLAPLLRMITLGCEGRQMIRERKFRYPEADPRLLHDLLPLLCTWCVLHETDPSPDNSSLGDKSGKLPGVNDGWGVPLKAVTAVRELLPRSEPARRLTQTFALQRLMERDWLSCARTCRLLMESLKTPALLEGWDFAAAMAGRLAELCKSEQLTPSDALWQWAMDGILLKAVDSHTQVHEEVLRLLLVVAPHLDPAELCGYLKETLDNSKRSRKSKAQSKGKRSDEDEMDLMMGFGVAGVGSDIGSDGWAGISTLKLKASDNVKEVYGRFVKVKGVDRETAPELFAYLAESNKGQVQQQGQLGAAAQSVPAAAMEELEDDVGDMEE